VGDEQVTDKEGTCFHHTEARFWNCAGHCEDGRYGMDLVCSAIADEVENRSR
jgi:uncharacterized protein YsxB (DUF464 family)